MDGLYNCYGSDRCSLSDETHISPIYIIYLLWTNRRRKNPRFRRYIWFIRRRPLFKKIVHTGDIWFENLKSPMRTQILCVFPGVLLLGSAAGALWWHGFESPCYSKSPHCNDCSDDRRATWGTTTSVGRPVFGFMHLKKGQDWLYHNQWNPWKTKDTRTDQPSPEKHNFPSCFQSHWYCSIFVVVLPSDCCYITCYFTVTGILW